MAKKFLKSDKPLGVRLNNPLNIRKSKSVWQGTSAVANNTPFVRFKSNFWGWRAALLIMSRTYYERGWRTPKQIIEHWAPYTENDTLGYIKFVTSYSGLEADKPMPNFQEDWHEWASLLKGMAAVELGLYWSIQVVADGLYDAIQVLLAEERLIY